MKYRNDLRYFGFFLIPDSLLKQIAHFLDAEIRTSFLIFCGSDLL